MNLLDEMNALRNGDLANVKNIFLLNRWLSGSNANLALCRDVNRLFYYLKPKWAAQIMHYRMSKNNTFIKYPKATKFDDRKFDLLSKALKKKYHWSNKVVNMHKQIIINLLDDEEFIKQTANDIGWDNSERKIFNLEVNKFVKPKPVREKDLFSF